MKRWRGPDGRFESRAKHRRRLARRRAAALGRGRRKGGRQPPRIRGAFARFLIPVSEMRRAAPVFAVVSMLSHRLYEGEPRSAVIPFAMGTKTPTEARALRESDVLYAWEKRAATLSRWSLRSVGLFMALVGVGKRRELAKERRAASWSYKARALRRKRVEERRRERRKKSERKRNRPHRTKGVLRGHQTRSRRNRRRGR